MKRLSVTHSMELITELSNGYPTLGMKKAFEFGFLVWSRTIIETEESTGHEFTDRLIAHAIRNIRNSDRITMAYSLTTVEGEDTKLIMLDINGHETGVDSPIYDIKVLFHPETGEVGI